MVPSVASIDMAESLHPGTRDEPVLRRSLSLLHQKGTCRVRRPGDWCLGRLEDWETIGSILRARSAPDPLTRERLRVAALTVNTSPICLPLR